VTGYHWDKSIDRDENRRIRNGIKQVLTINEYCWNKKGTGVNDRMIPFSEGNCDEQHDSTRINKEQ
jgi:hypothetical protein